MLAVLCKDLRFAFTTMVSYSLSAFMIGKSQIKENSVLEEKIQRPNFVEFVFVVRINLL